MDEARQHLDHLAKLTALLQAAHRDSDLNSILDLGTYTLSVPKSFLLWLCATLSAINGVPG